MDDFDLYSGHIIATDATDGEVRAQIGWDIGKGHCAEVSLLTPWGFYSRPMPAAASGEACHAMYFRDGDEFFVMGVHDNRYNAKVGAMKDGDVMVLHPSGGFVQMTFADNETRDATALTLYTVRNSGADPFTGEPGTPEKAHVFVMSSKADDAHVSLVHEAGQSITLTKDTNIVIMSHDGKALIDIKGDQITISASSINLTGGVNMGAADPVTTDQVALGTSGVAHSAEVIVAIGQIAALLNVAGPVNGAPGTVTPVTTAILASSKVKAAF